jgi:hypothetical protein
MSKDHRRRGLLRRDHPCATAFLDETGSISQDRFFAVGLLKHEEASRLLRAVHKLRDQTHWYKEIKFSQLTATTLPLYRQFIDVALRSGPAQFFCFVADRSTADPVERFGSTWAAYSKLAEQLVVAALHPDELVTILADNYSTPDAILFEEELRESVNRRLRRLAVVAALRLDSRSSDGLQIADLLTSAIAFEFRAQAGLASSSSPKAMLARHVRTSLGAETCVAGWRSDRHSVAIYHHGSWSPQASQDLDA